MADSSAHQEYGRTRIEWIANLNTEYQPPKVFRRTSIICTIGGCKAHGSICERYESWEVQRAIH